MTRTETIDRHFEEYWELLAKSTCSIFVDCNMVPNYNSFQAILKAAYGMGWSESEEERHR